MKVKSGHIRPWTLSYYNDEFCLITMTCMSSLIRPLVRLSCKIVLGSCAPVLGSCELGLVGFCHINTGSVAVGKTWIKWMNEVSEKYSVQASLWMLAAINLQSSQTYFCWTYVYYFCSIYSYWTYFCWT